MNMKEFNIIVSIRILRLADPFGISQWIFYA